MPPRNPELPEGTDHIINGAMETGAGADASVGSSGGDGSALGGSGGIDSSGGTGTTGSTGGGSFGAGTTGGGGSSSGFIGSGSDDTGGTAMATSGGDMGGTGAGGASGAPVKQQLRDGVQSLKGQATDKVRNYALDGKERATTALDDLSNMVRDAAGQIDEKLGGDYAQYAHRAADAVSGFADTIRNKEVDDLFDDARNVVRKSPGLAIGAAAVVGFTLVRLIKAGLDENTGTGGGGAAGAGTGGSDVRFTPEAGRNMQFDPDIAASAGAGPVSGA